jgi:N-acetylmuramoyl-L-alanine amidase
MKKVFLAALMIFAMGVLLRAADGFVQVKSLEALGYTVTYDWKLDKAEITGKGGSAEIVLDYPFVVSNERSYRTDSPPYIQDGALYISAYTVEKIKEAISGDVPRIAEPVEVKVVTQTVETPRPIKTAVTAGKIKSTVTAEPAAAATAVENDQPVIVEKGTEIPAAGRAADTVKIIDPSRNTSSRKLIVLDPGHGGNDPGATGYNGLREKDVVLNVAQLVKRHLKSYNADVLLTRDTDEFITLKNRAIYANSRKADLFVSIHCNASGNRSASGTRSYIYDRVASSKEAAEAAKFENKNTGALEFLMNDLRKSAYEYLSIEAAGNIQQDLISGLKLKWMPTERAPFYVIANTNMPSVLVEIAFISNPKEEQKLDSPGFKDEVSISIAKGITQYLDKVK